LLNETKSMFDGLKEAFEWYKDNKDKVNSKLYMEYIDSNIVL